MILQFCNARVLRPDRTWATDCPVTVENGVIRSVGEDCAADRVVDLSGRYLAPGLVDMHTHGRLGYDFTTAAADELRLLKADYARHGVTSVFATFASAAPEEWLTAIDRVRDAGFAGVHFEGRYLNPKKRGAHAPELLAPLDAEELSVFLRRAKGLPCHVTAALELDPDGSFAAKALSLGATLALGHTDATFAEAQTALKHGATCFTHLCNAMPPLHHRAGGAICAALTSDAYAELIVDGIHVAPEMVNLIFRVKGPDRFVLVTDSINPAGKEDGNYTSAGMPVVVRNGRAETTEGVLAGSMLDLFTAVRNLMDFTGASLADALTCASRNPARAVGLDGKIGSIEPGKRADLISIDDDLRLCDVWQNGVRV